MNIKKKMILVISIITLGFFISLNTRAQDVNLDTLVASNNYNSNATKLIITSDKNLNKINMLNMPNLVQVNISDVNIPNSSVIHFKNKLKLLYLKNVVINMDGIYDDNIEKIETRYSYIYGNSYKSKKYEIEARFGAKFIESPTYNSEINKIAQSIYKNGMSKEDIIREVTLYVTNHITYNISKAGSEYNYAANSLSGQGVCSEYAYLESQLLNKLGIYTLTVYGYPVDRDEYHAWNVVYLNNNWYTIDPTWLDIKGNSNTYDPSNERYQKYYLRPVSANIYKPDFTLYNSIPTSERVAKSIIQTTNTNTNTTTNNQTTSNQNNNSNNTPNQNTNSQTNTNSNNNTTTNNQTTSNQNNNSNNTTNQNTNSQTNTNSNNNNTTTNNQTTSNQNNNSNNTTNQNTSDNTNSNTNKDDNIIIENTKPNNDTKVETIENTTNNQNNTNNEENKNNKDYNVIQENNTIDIANEVEVPDTSSNNILFIILGMLTLIFGTNFILKQKD